MTLTTAELELFNNSLNEVCNGVSDLDHDSEFATRLGASRQQARALLVEVHALLERSRALPQ